MSFMSCSIIVAWHENRDPSSIASGEHSPNWNIVKWSTNNLCLRTQNNYYSDILLECLIFTFRIWNRKAHDCIYLKNKILTKKIHKSSLISIQHIWRNGGMSIILTFSECKIPSSQPISQSIVTLSGAIVMAGINIIRHVCFALKHDRMLFRKLNLSIYWWNEWTD